jgi:hypothetical protein
MATQFLVCPYSLRRVDYVWNVMAHGDAREEKWRGNWRMEWVTSKHHIAAEHKLARAVQTLQADVYSSPASSRLNWFPRRFKWTRPLRRKKKSGFCARVITFQTQSACFHRTEQVKGRSTGSLRAGKDMTMDPFLVPVVRPHLKALVLQSNREHETG